MQIRRKMRRCPYCPRFSMMYLSVGFPLRDLAERLNFHRTTAGRIISTWTHFLYCLLESKHLWVHPEIVRAHLPPEFAAFSDTYVVLDYTEIFSVRCHPLCSFRVRFSRSTNHTLHSRPWLAWHPTVLSPSCLDCMQAPRVIARSSSCQGL